MCIISVVVPVYNAQKYLRCCIESILKQTFTDFELLLIDDGSIDASLSICNDYLGDCRVRVIHQENKGVSVARNEGIKNAQGQWIMFVDADDNIEYDMLSIMYEATINHPLIDFVACGYRVLIWEHGGAHQIYTHAHKTLYFKNKKSFANNALQYMDLLCGPCCKLFNKAVLRKNNIYFPLNMSNGEDTVFVFRYLNYITSACVLDAVCYNYHIREHSSLSAKFNETRIKAYLYCCEVIADYLHSNNIDSPYDDPYYRTRLAYVGYLGAIYLHRNKICYAERKSLLIQINSKQEIKKAFVSSQKLSIRDKTIQFTIRYNLYFLEDILFCTIETLRKHHKLFNFIKTKVALLYR